MADTVPSSPAEDRAGEFNRRSVAAAICGALGIMFGPGPMIVGNLGLLATAIAADMGWSRTLFSVAPIFMAWTAALTAPLYGRMMDRAGLRRVVLPAIAAFGTTFVLVAVLATRTWHFFLLYFATGLAAGALGPVGYNKLVAQWFTRSRGLVIALCAALGSGVGYAVMPQYVHWLIETRGWRVAYLGIAALVLGISLPGAWLLLRERRGTTAASAASPAGEGVTFSEGLRTASFWLLALILLLAGNALYGTMIHLVPIVADRGLKPYVAAVVSLFALGAVGGQLAASLLLDRVASPKVALPFFLCGLAGVTLIHLGEGLLPIGVGTVLIGVAQGSEMSVIAYVTSRILGLRAFGALYGIIYGAVTFSAGSGPLLMGVVYDHAGSYVPAFLANEASMALAILFVLLLPPYAYGARRRPAA